MTSIAAASAATRYKVDDLGAVSTPYATAVGGINGHGVVAASVLVGDILVCAVLDHGDIKSIGTLGGTDCFANGINDSGVVVGSSLISGDSGVVHAFSYAKGAMKDLGTDAGYPDSEAVGINASGHIAGNSFDAVQEAAYLYHRGIFHTVSMPTGAMSIAARAIAKDGEVTGSALLVSGHGHAFLFAPDGSFDLGTLGGLSNGDSEGLGVNDKGQVVGWSSGVGFRMHAMLATSSGMVDLGTLPPADPFATSEATGINHKGVVVGVSDDGMGDTVAFVHDGKRMRDMNRLLVPGSAAAWQLVSAQSINEHGQIAGMAISRADGSRHVFLATPSPKKDDADPKP